jgi:hypothetical protein
MKRVIRTWPYVAVVVLLYAGWLALSQLPGTTQEVQNLLVIYGGMFAMSAVAGTGAVLAYRRGYDWVAVVTCLIAFLVFAAVGDLTVLHQPPAWAAIGVAAVGYTLLGHIGIGAALGVAKLGST